MISYSLQANGKVDDKGVGCLHSSPQLQSTLAQQGQIPVVRDAVVEIDHIQQAQAVFATSEPLPISPAMSSYWEPLTNAINQVLDSNGDAGEVVGGASAEIESRLP